MHRRRALRLFATAIGVSVSSQAHAFVDPASCPEHVAWVGKVMEKMETIKVGDTRKRLLRVFTSEGGLSTALEHTYVSQDCPLFKVDAKFQAVGRPERDSDGRETSVESDNDIITALSRPYLCVPSLRLILTCPWLYWKGSRLRIAFHPRRQKRRVQNRGGTLRRLILLVALAALAHPAGAGTRVTVAQLDQALTAAIAAHKPDAEIARQLASLELSERLTEASLNRLNIRLAQDALAAQALALLADRSAFLDPPVAELPGTAAPDGAARQRMLDAARNYVAQTLPRLPDFLATRTIKQYDDSPRAPKKGAWPVRAGLHLVGTSSREISVRNEREGQGVKHGSAASQEQNGLNTWGEFGFLPALILADTVKGTVTWSHWEQIAAGPAAVFHYAVPHSASHYEIVGTIAHGPRMSFLRQPADASTVRTAPAYHGSLWVDPETGVVLRLSLEIGENEVGQFKRFAVMVQYAPVQIGGRNFICPARSLALDLTSAGVTSALTDAPTEWLNIVSYSNYHRFAATARIVTDTSEAQPEKPGSASELPQATSPVPNETASAIESNTLPESGLPPSSSALDSPTESAPTAPAVPAPTVPAPIGGPTN